MDTEDAIQRHLDAHPDDHTARLALADWLEENAGTVECGKCGGTGSHALSPYELANRYGVGTATRILDAAMCGHCLGSGRVSDGRRERAAGYRAMAANGWRPDLEAAGPGFPGQAMGQKSWTWWNGGALVFRLLLNAAPPDVFLVMHRSAPHRDESDVPDWVEDVTRQEAEDRFARAFAALPADRQRELLTPAETPA